MKHSSEKTAIVLAGGKSSRMGFDKCFIKHNGISLIENTINVVSKLAENIILSANSAEYIELGYKVVPDFYKNIGPLGGISVGLQNSTTDLNLISACDLPFIKSELFEYLLSFYNNQNAIVPVFKGKVEPLTGVYSKKILQFIEEKIKQKRYKILDMLKSANASFVEITEDLPFYSENLFANLNTQNDLNKYLKS